MCAGEIRIDDKGALEGRFGKAGRPRRIAFEFFEQATGAAKPCPCWSEVRVFGDADPEEIAGKLDGVERADDEEFFAAGKPCFGCDLEFFPEGHVKSNFLCNLGYGNPTTLFPRLPRLPFNEACSFL